jgi:protein unc-119
MIEKHYFKGQLIKAYDFHVPFCIPNTTNSLEAMYELPSFGPELEQEMINSPFETVSDSFYFVDGKLVMHNKAAYSYAPFE